MGPGCHAQMEIVWEEHAPPLWEKLEPSLMGVRKQVEDSVCCINAGVWMYQRRETLDGKVLQDESRGRTVRS